LAGGFVSATIFRTSRKKGEKKMNSETSKAGNTIWAFDLGKGSIGEAVPPHPPRSQTRLRVVQRPGLFGGLNLKSEIANLR
jgi:hypothetical protein